jgi:hypothetical protein
MSISTKDTDGCANEPKQPSVPKLKDKYEPIILENYRYSYLEYNKEKDCFEFVEIWKDDSNS